MLEGLHTYVVEPTSLSKCNCPRDEEGDIDRGFIQRRDEYGHVVAREWFLLVNPKCPVHGDPQGDSHA